MLVKPSYDDEPWLKIAKKSLYIQSLAKITVGFDPWVPNLSLKSLWLPMVNWP